MKRFLVILLMGMFIFCGCESKDENIKADIEKYEELLTNMYIFYYKKYNPVRCAHTQYKGYLFIKCFEAGGDHTQGGVYVVDDTATNKFGGFDVYAINGKAITHRGVMLKSANKELGDLKILPAPAPKWLDLVEIHNLIDSRQNFEGEYIKQSLFVGDATE